MFFPCNGEVCFIIDVAMVTLLYAAAADHTYFPALESLSLRMSGINSVSPEGSAAVSVVHLCLHITVVFCQCNCNFAFSA